jgi:hypothetical protein
MITVNSLTKDDILSCSDNTIFLEPHTDCEELNQYAKKSLTVLNDAKRKAKDEAVSIHIITKKLKAYLSIKFERELLEFHGKPDYIIRLGSDKFIMVSVARIIDYSNSRYDKLNIDEINRIVTKKINGMDICKNNLECLIDEVLPIKYNVHPIIHFLCPTLYVAILCLKVCKKLNNNSKILITYLDIKLII